MVLTKESNGSNQRITGLIPYKPLTKTFSILKKPSQNSIKNKKNESLNKFCIMKSTNKQKNFNFLRLNVTKKAKIGLTTTV